jgi:hypothetical protein
MTKLINTIERWGEAIFIILAILTIPIWFPIVVTWVVVDPTYRISIWCNKSR